MDIAEAGENIIKQYNTLDELYNDFNNTAEIMKLHNNLSESRFWRFVLLKDLQPIDIKYEDGRKREIIIDRKTLRHQIENSKFITFQHKVLYEYFEFINLCKARKDNKLDNKKIVLGDFRLELLRYDIKGDWYIKGFNTVKEVHAYIKSEYFGLKMKA